MTFLIHTQRAVADFLHCLTLAEMTFSFGKTFYICSLQPFDPQETLRLTCCCLFPEANKISNELTRLEVYYPIYVYVWNCFGRKSCCTSTQFIHHKCNSSQICESPLPMLDNILFWKCGNNSILRGNSAVRKRPKESREIAAVKRARRQSEKKKNTNPKCRWKPEAFGRPGVNYIYGIYIRVVVSTANKQTSKARQRERGRLSLSAL